MANLVNSTEHNFTEDKTEGRKTHELAATEEMPAGFRQSLTAKDLHHSVKNNVYIYNYVILSNFFWVKVKMLHFLNCNLLNWSWKSTLQLHCDCLIQTVVKKLSLST